MNGVLIENEYDSENNPTKTTLTSKDGIILKSEREYDETKRFIVKETDSQGNSTSLEYTKDGNLKKVTDALSAVTELSYNNNGLIEKLISKYGQMSAEAVLFCAYESCLNRSRRDDRYLSYRLYI